MDYMPSQSLAAHDYAERLNAALARLGLTDRLTLPPAPNTAIDELPGVVDVPLRKTLSVLMGKAEQGDASALATLEMTAQVMESIFAGLHARDFAGDRPLALPSHESLATLSQGVDALLPRKISNGAWSLLADGTPSDGIDDGVSLVRLLCSSAADSVTELKDDNEGWVMTKALPNSFANVERIVLRCKRWEEAADRLNPMIKDYKNVKEVIADELEYIPDDAIGSRTTCSLLNGLTACEMVSLKSLKRARIVYPTGGANAVLFYGMPSLKVVYLDGIEYINVYRVDNFVVRFASEDSLEKLYLGYLNSEAHAINLSNQTSLSLISLKGCSGNFNLSTWNPTSVLSDSERLPIFLSNFKTYIAERLSEQGSGKTLTLSQAVRDAIEGDPTIAQIITSKGWSISPAPSV